MRHDIKLSTLRLYSAATKSYGHHNPMYHYAQTVQCVKSSVRLNYFLQDGQGHHMRILTVAVRVFEQFGHTGLEMGHGVRVITVWWW